MRTIIDSFELRLNYSRINTKEGFISGLKMDLF
jgi:hypothetical protein